jgi:hypothetical protein
MQTTVQALEEMLQARKLDRTVLRPEETEADRRRAVSTGIEALDLALSGGWRRGEVSELVGGRSSGRSSTMVATLAAATRRGEWVALIDAFDRFDPASASQAGIRLEQLLWVRGPACTLEGARPGLIDRAVRQAIRALDLVVRAGGFSVVLLDLSDVPSLFFRALPSTTWLRLAHANEGREMACVLMVDRPVGRSARGVTLRLTASGCWAGDSPQRRRLEALDVRSTLGLARRSHRDRAAWLARSA